MSSRQVMAVLSSQESGDVETLPPVDATEGRKDMGVSLRLAG